MIKNHLRSLGTLLLRLGPTLLSLLSPWGLLRLAIVGAAGAFVYFSGTGSKLLDGIGSLCGKMKDILLTAFGMVKTLFFKAFGDIVALVQEGRIEDAIQLMWLKIQLLFEQGKLWVVNTFQQVVAAVTEPFMAIYDTVSSVLAPLWQWVSDTASTVANYVYDAWDQSMGWLGDLFGTWWGSILDGWDALQNDLGTVIVGGWWSIATGINNAFAWIRTKWNEHLTNMQTTWLTAGKAISRQIGFLVAKISGLNPDDVMADIERQYNLQILGVEDRSAAKSEGIEASRQGWQDYLDDMAVRSLDRVNAAKAGAPQSNERIDQLKLEIAELRKPSSAESDPKNDPKGESFRQMMNDALAGMRNAAGKGLIGSSGTFSAFEIGTLDNGIEKDQLVELKEIKRGINNLKPTASKWKA